MSEFKTEKKDWERVLNTMLRYNRVDGHINIINNELTFFDSYVIINDVASMHVTRAQVEEYINNFNQN
jgi:hypothetical protein